MDARKRCLELTPILCGLLVDLKNPTSTIKPIYEEWYLNLKEWERLVNLEREVST